MRFSLALENTLKVANIAANKDPNIMGNEN